MRLLFNNSDFVAKWVGDRIPHCDDGDFGECQAVGVVNNDNHLVAGYVYHNWSPREGVMEISCASETKKWFNRHIMNQMFSHPFATGGQMIVTRVRAENKPLIRQFVRMGFNTYTIPRLCGRDMAETVCTLTDDDWAASKYSDKLIMENCHG